MTSRLHLISSVPSRPDAADQINSVARAARWAEAAGHEALLVGPETGPTDNWAMAQLVLEQTSNLVPVVTVQPVVEHPYSVARRIATLYQVYGRTPHLELGTRATPNDLPALGIQSRAESRQTRLLEFGQVVRAHHKTNKDFQVAVKVISKKKHSRHLRMIKQEFALLKNLDHPNIANYQEQFEDEHNLYLVMELCSGGELFDKMVSSAFGERDAAAAFRLLF